LDTYLVRNTQSVAPQRELAPGMQSRLLTKAHIVLDRKERRHARSKSNLFAWRQSDLFIGIDQLPRMLFPIATGAVETERGRLMALFSPRWEQYNREYSRATDTIKHHAGRNVQIAIGPAIFA